LTSFTPRFRGEIVRIRLGRHRLPCLDALGEGIDRNLSDVAVGHERLEIRGILPFVGVVLVDRIAHLEEIFLQHGLIGPDHAVLVLRHPHRRQDDDEQDDDQQLDHREAAGFSGAAGDTPEAKRAKGHRITNPEYQALHPSAPRCSRLIRHVRERAAGERQTVRPHHKRGLASCEFRRLQ